MTEIQPPGTSEGEDARLRLKSKIGYRTVAATVVGSGMVFLDSTVVNVALPKIQDELGADLAGLQWVVTGYLLTLGALLLLGGALGDLKGRRAVFSIGLALFTGANLTTVTVYAALGGGFFFLGLQLQTVLGYSALEAGAATVPITVLLATLSSRMGRLAQRIGPRLPMTIGPLIAAGGYVMLSQVEPGTHYVTGVLPGVIVFGLGLAVTVAPLVGAVLMSVDERLTGTASGINNAVSRVAQLLAIALLPLAAGLGGVEVGSPEFAAGYEKAALITAALLALGGVTAFLTVRD